MKYYTNTKDIGRNIRHFRILRDMKQSELGNRIGYSMSTISRLERGERGKMPLPEVTAIAGVLGVSVEDLLRDPDLRTDLRTGLNTRIRREYKPKEPAQTETVTPSTMDALRQKIESLPRSVDEIQAYLETMAQIAATGGHITVIDPDEIFNEWIAKKYIKGWDECAHAKAVMSPPGKVVYTGFETEPEKEDQESCNCEEEVRIKKLKEDYRAELERVHKKYKDIIAKEDIETNAVVLGFILIIVGIIVVAVLMH